MINQTITLIVILLTAVLASGQEGLRVESETNLGQATDSSTPAMRKTEAQDPKPILPPKGMVPKGLSLLGLNNYFAAKSLVFDKQRRTLTLWESDKSGQLKLLKAYPSDFGRKPGDKERLGDLKTPEGIYFFETTYFGAQLDFREYGNRAFTMDYPNFFDRQERKTGSGIWLHAIPPSKTLDRGSRGCIVVRNDAIEELKQHITLKNMPIVVFDYVEYITPEQHGQQQKQRMQWLNEWKAAWTSKNIEQYIEHYDQSFTALKMNRSQWQSYKAGLNEKYEFIKVSITEPLIVSHKDELIVRFMQQYQSDNHSDVGEKTLYLKRNDYGNYKIVHEKWAEVSKEALASKGLNGDFSQAAN